SKFLLPDRGKREILPQKKKNRETKKRCKSPLFIARISSEEEKEETLRKGKSEEFPHLVRGTPIIYRPLFLICKREILIRGRSVRRREETQKRLLPVQVRTASFFLLNGEGRDLL
ncbi:hypothetical protein, partial [Porphyromonas endodontalis]|uniref:hypothetical protein n=1 Tax=Porphyromonas endodontalis TaxID=28124 RepID=UPI0028E734DA